MLVSVRGCSGSSTRVHAYTSRSCSARATKVQSPGHGESQVQPQMYPFPAILPQRPALTPLPFIIRTCDPVFGRHSSMQIFKALTIGWGDDENKEEVPVDVVFAIGWDGGYD